MSKALSLVERLRKRVASGDLGAATQSYSAGQVALLGRGEDGQTSYSWDPETLRLVDWLNLWQPPLEPFVLATDEQERPTLTVQDPALLKRSLLIDLAAGPGGVRSRTGALQSDLSRLYQLFGGS